MTDQPSNQSSLTPASITAAVAAAWPDGGGGTCHSIGPDWVKANIRPSAATLRPGGFISGPTQFALADLGLWFMTFVALDKIELMALTSDLSIRYLRPAIGETLWVRATLEKAGRRSVVGSFRIWTDDNEAKPAATGQGTYMLPSTA